MKKEPEPRKKAGKPSYRLEDLVRQCDPTAAPPKDLETWDYAKPVGREKP